MDQDDIVQSADEDIDDIEKQRMVSRRDFLVGLRKWSTAVIGVAVAGAVFLPGETASGWVNGRGGGGSWVNRSGGGGWVNGGGGGGGSWVNRRGY